MRSLGIIYIQRWIANVSNTWKYPNIHVCIKIAIDYWHKALNFKGFRTVPHTEFVGDVQIELGNIITPMFFFLLNALSLFILRETWRHDVVYLMVWTIRQNVLANLSKFLPRHASSYSGSLQSSQFMIIAKHYWRFAGYTKSRNTRHTCGKWYIHIQFVWKSEKEVTTWGNIGLHGK